MTTLLVEPNPRGHRFQSVAMVADLAARTGDVVLLTSVGATSDGAFGAYLADAPISVDECFDTDRPGTADITAKVARWCRSVEVGTVVVMDADQALKRWWYAAPLAFRRLRMRPRVVFMLTRYPAKLRFDDWVGWRLRIPKALLALAAMGTRALDRVVGYTGRDDMSTGWIVKRIRDPEICTAHSRDRAALREELGLPQDRQLLGVFGVITERKNAPLILESLQVVGIDADLVLAGSLAPEVRTWLEQLPVSSRARVVVRDEYLPNDVLDKFVAAVDVVPLALTLNGPSGIMGKALAADVSVVSAGSLVRARELMATDAGETADLTPESIGAAVARVLDRPLAERRRTAPPATTGEFAETLLGVGVDGRLAERPRRRHRR